MLATQSKGSEVLASSASTSQVVLLLADGLPVDIVGVSVGSIVFGVSVVSCVVGVSVVSCVVGVSVVSSVVGIGGCVVGVTASNDVCRMQKYQNVPITDELYCVPGVQEAVSKGIIVYGTSVSVIGTKKKRTLTTACRYENTT